MIEDSDLQAKKVGTNENADLMNLGLWLPNLLCIKDFKFLQNIFNDRITGIIKTIKENIESIVSGSLENMKSDHRNEKLISENMIKLQAIGEHIQEFNN
jgi:hypothetical protein